MTELGFAEFFGISSVFLFFPSLSSSLLDALQNNNTKLSPLVRTGLMPPEYSLPKEEIG